MDTSPELLDAKLRLLYDLSAALGSVADLDALLRQTVEAAARVLHAEAGSVLLVDDERRELMFEVATGPGGPRLAHVHFPLDEVSIAGWVATNARPVRIVDVRGDPRWAQRFDDVTGFTTRSMLCVPLIARGPTVGVIQLLNKRSGEPFDEGDERLLLALAGPMATAIENARLYRALAGAYLDTLHALAAAVEEKDNYTAEHIQRVSSFSLGVAGVLGLEGADLDAVQYGSVLHDVGKIGVDARVLRKPGPLTPKEWTEVRRHVEIGARLVPRATLLQGARLCVRHHHERFDGGGYPDGLAAQGIPLSARIVAVADSYDAMTSDRSYRRGLSVAETLERLRGGSGDQWDPEVVRCFLALHDELSRE
ncbi:MAG: GAF domain-containing protein [Chloroflexi bacterium]|nr:GAF domain-containing protein [Chloroflexota bacterium]MBI4507951.1 GAF domain-containing protein [Chloroflexota bacterium]